MQHRASLKVISENEMFGGVCAEMKQHLQSQSHFSMQKQSQHQRRARENMTVKTKVHFRIF